MEAEVSKIEIRGYFLFWLIIFLWSAWSLLLTCHIDVNKSMFKSSSLLENSVMSTFKDTKDTEWSLVYECLCQLKWQATYILLRTLVGHITILSKCVHLCISCGIVCFAVSPILVVICVFLSLLYYFVGYLFKSKYVIWIIAVGTFALSEHFTETIVNFHSNDSFSFQKFTMLQSSLALIILRVTSIGLEHANTHTSFPNSIVVSYMSLEGLLEALLYALYPPTFVFGPMTLFGDWCVWRQLQIPNLQINRPYKGCLSRRRLSFRRLICRVVRLVVWFCVWEVFMHIVYPNALIFTLTQPAIDVKPAPIIMNSSFHGSPHIVTDRWALANAVYLLSLQFYFSYMQLYGWPGILSDAESLLTKKKTTLEEEHDCLVPDGPPCFSHILLFSEIWRKFDRGLYNFLKWYVYLPWMKPTEEERLKKSSVGNINTGIRFGVSLLQRLQAGAFCFVFVLIYHSWNQENAIWVFINVLQIVLERFVQWTFMHTHLGAFLRQKVSTGMLRRLEGVLCASSAIFSSIGFFYFYQGYLTGQWIAYWMLSDPIYRVVAIVVYYTTYQISVETRRWCNYAA